MARPYVIYNSEAVFAGPAPASGFFFVDYAGALNNDLSYAGMVKNHNLLKQLDRITRVEYSVDIQRKDITQLGTFSLVNRAIIQSPTVNVSLDYYVVGAKNEARLGLYVNYPRVQHPYSGQPFYSSRVSPISGFVASTLEYPTGDPPWPASYRDKRNLFVVVHTGNQDLKVANKEDFNSPDVGRHMNSGNSGYEVISFGNCYLDSYSNTASVGDLPRASVSFTAENVKFDSSGNATLTPALDYKTNTPVSGGKLFYVPPLIDEGGVSALLPGDIILDITSTGQSVIPDLGLNFTGISITSYNFSVNFNRQSLDGLSYKLPMDRKVTPPFLVNLGMEIIVGETQTGVLNELSRKDLEYDISIKLKHPRGFGDGIGPTGLYNAGILNRLQDVAVKYDFFKSKLSSFSSSSAIAGHKTASLSYSIEINPYDTTKGFFISGVLNVDKIEDFVLDEDGTYVLDEDGSLIVSNYVPLF